MISSQSSYHEPCRFRIKLTRRFCRPANILLSTKGIPVLVDFGFAERYDTKSKRAFLSNLAYGTPEVSPEFSSDHAVSTSNDCGGSTSPPSELEAMYMIRANPTCGHWASHSLRF